MAEKQVCKRCLFDSDTPSVTFDSNGVCNYCRLHDEWEKQYPAAPNGGEPLKKIFKEIKKAGKELPLYDCLVGVSGGCDSSYTLHLAVKAGLRPLAVHFHNNWDTEIAQRNIEKMVSGCKVDYYEIAVGKEEYDDICRSFILAGVPDADIPNDIGLQTAFYLAAERHGIKYTLSGHSFRTEGTTPLGWSYMDGKYIESVQKKFGRFPLNTFPNLWLEQWMKWVIFSGIKQIRPLWYVSYNKNDVRKMLSRKYGWQWYGGAHLENKYTEFIGSYYHPRRFKIDLRKVLWGAQVRSGTMDREQALKDLQVMPTVRPEILREVEERLGFTESKLLWILGSPTKTYKNYRTYLPTFRKSAWLFKILADMDLVPRTFYTKYCKGVAPS